jgi:hypothetical protein
MDMHARFRKAVEDDPEIKHAVIVHGPFHIMKPTLEHDGKSPPYDHQASNDESLAQILVVFCIALIDVLTSSDPS